MTYLRIDIVRFVDESQPGFVECSLVDAVGRQHLFMEKLPVVSLEDLRPDSDYPQPGEIRCGIQREWTDAEGRALCAVTTLRPWSIESTEGLSEFMVLRSQLRHP